MLIYQILWFNTILDPSWLQSHMALNLNGTAFTFSTGLAKNSRQGLVGWLTFSVKGNWLAGITWKAWPLIKREGNRGWAAKWFVLSIHVPVSLHYRVALASSSAQHSMGVFVTSCCTHCFLSWLKVPTSLFLVLSIPDWDVRLEGEQPQRSLWINIYLIAANRSLLLSVTAEMGRGKKTPLWGNQTKRAPKSHADQQTAMYQWGGHWGNDIDWENVPSMKKITYNYI